MLRQPAQKKLTKNDLPPEFKPIGAWSYFWLGVLYSIPVVGFIFLLVHTFGAKNVNVKSFARSHWIPVLLYAILTLVLIILGLIFGLGAYRSGALQSFLESVRNWLASIPKP